MLQLPLDISLSDIKELSAELDYMIQKEKKADQFAVVKIKDYVISRLEESFKKQKLKTNMQPLTASDGLGFIESFCNNYQQLNDKGSKLASLWSEAKSQIFKLDLQLVLEANRINKINGFVAACNFLLDQPIVVIPKSFPTRLD